MTEPRRPPRRWLRRVILWGGLAAGILMLNITGCAERLFYVPTREPTPPPTLLARRGTPAESVWFESSDGTGLRGWFLPAKGRPSRDALTVVHVHGNAGSLLGHIAFSSHLAEAGFNLFIFDYRGYGESEGAAITRGPLIEDAKAAVRTVRARPDVDPARVALYGHSLGGGIAVNVLADDPTLLGAVLESPISSWRDAAATVIGGDPPAWWARWLSFWMIPDDRRPVDAIARVHRPILILHGDADRIVTVGHGRRLAAAAPSARLVELPAGEHNTLQETHPETVRLMHEFLRELDAAGQTGR